MSAVRCLIIDGRFAPMLVVLQLIAVAAAALLVSGCGGTARPAPSTPREALVDYLRAVASGDRKAACALSVDPCADDVTGDASRAGASDELRWRLHYVQAGGGDWARLEGHLGRHSSSWELQRGDGGWRVVSGSQSSSSG